MSEPEVRLPPQPVHSTRGRSLRLTVMKSEDPDRDLVDTFRARRDELAFRALYSRHTPYLFGLARRTVAGTTASAEELVQETWIRAVERVDGFEGRSRFRTWLSGILLNCRREQVRAQERSREDALEVDPPAPPPADPQERLDLESALERLPDGYREVVVLHYLYGYPHHEIGSLLGIRTGTSKSQASRGIQKLRALMQREPDEPTRGGVDR